MRSQRADEILERISHEVFNNHEVDMLHLAFSPSVSQERLNSVLEGWDLNEGDIKCRTIAFNLAKTHPEISFPEKYLKTLQDIKLSCRERYLMILSHFLKIIKVLDSKGIDYLLLKGGAMRVYRPDFSRWTADLDILVPEERYKEAQETIESIGYIPFKSIHSTGFKDPATRQAFVDIHRFVGIGTVKAKILNEDLVRRSISLPFSSLTVRVPSPEDMVFISMVNFWKNVMERSSDNSVANLCFDLKFLKEYNGALNWDIIRSEAIATDTVEAVYIAKKILSEVLPDFFPIKFIEGDIDPSKLAKLVSRTCYTRDSVRVLRQFNLSEAFKNIGSLFKYFLYRCKFFVVKRFHLILP